MGRRSTRCSPHALATAEAPGTEGEPPVGSEPSPVTPAEPLSVYGDSAYGAGSVLDTLERADAEIMCKVQAPNAPGGRYAKDAFGIDLEGGHGHVPRRPDRRAATDQERAHRPLRRRVPVMPARGPVHHLARWTLDPRRPLRAATRPRSRAADRPGMEGRLHRHPPESRTQDRTPDATPTRRPPRPRSRAHESRRRLQPSRCRGEPRHDSRRSASHTTPPGGRQVPPDTLSRGLHPLSAAHRCHHPTRRPPAHATPGITLTVVTANRPSRPPTAGPRGALQPADR